MQGFDEAAYWRKRYASGGRSGARRSDEHEWLVDQVRKWAHDCDDILDMGCGSGELAEKYVGARGWAGWDVAHHAVQKAQAKGLAAAQVNFSDGPAHSPADLVICFNVLYHLPTPRKVAQALSNMATNARKRCLILTWNDMVLERFGELERHCFLWPLEAPPGHRVIWEGVIPCSPWKTLLVTEPE